MDNKYEIIWDDIPYDLKALVKTGIYTKEELIELVNKYNNVQNSND